MERETGFEPATSTLARSHSTTELFPLELSKLSSKTDRTQHVRRFFWRRRIDVEASPPLESGDARQLWQDFDVPVIHGRGVGAERRRMDDQVEVGALEGAVHPLQQRLQQPRDPLVLVTRR